MASTSAGPRQIVILRHGEKPANPSDPNLTAQGEQRAAMLAGAIPRLFPDPDFIFAAATSKNSNRPVETITPTAKALNLPVNDSISADGYDLLAQDLLTEPQYAGKLIIVCWHHGEIPDLGLGLKIPAAEMNNAEGMKGLHWDSSVFNLFWSVTFPNGQASLAITQQPPLPTS